MTFNQLNKLWEKKARNYFINKYNAQIDSEWNSFTKDFLKEQLFIDESIDTLKVLTKYEDFKNNFTKIDENGNKIKDIFRLKVEVNGLKGINHVVLPISSFNFINPESPVTVYNFVESKRTKRIYKKMVFKKSDLKVDEVYDNENDITFFAPVSK